MSHNFDPYHTWLGIPADETPPNHYRLLGISLFESNPDVIQNALDQRMAHLKSLATGPHTVLSQRLLNEVAQAGVCLLRPAKKLAYDAELRAALGADVQNVKTKPIAHLPPLVSAEQKTPATRESEFPGQFDPPKTMAAPGIAVSVPKGRGKKQPHSTRSALLVAQIILAGATGLFALGLILFLANSKPPSTVSLSNASHPKETAKNHDDNQAPEGATEHGESRPEPTVPSNKAVPEPTGLRPVSEPPPPEEVTGNNVVDPARNVAIVDQKSPPEFPIPNVKADPEPTKSRPAPDPLRPKVNEPISDAKIPSPLQVPDPSRQAPNAATPPPLRKIPKTIVIDLTRSVTYIKLPEVAEGDNVQVQVENVTRLSTPYILKPNHGVIGLGQPVDIVLTQHDGIKIRLSLLVRGKKTDLKLAPEIDIGQGKTAGFTKQRMKHVYGTFMKDATKLNRQLSAAKGEAAAIENWLASPSTKPLQLRGQKRKQLTVLKQQMIPALEQKVSYARKHAEALQRLSQLIEQIHEKATLHLEVQIEKRGTGALIDDPNQKRIQNGSKTVPNGDAVLFRGGPR